MYANCSQLVWSCTIIRFFGEILTVSWFSYIGFCCLVTKLCPTLCDPMDCRHARLPILHYLPEFAQTHVHGVSDDPTILSSVVPFSSCPESFPASGSFPVSQLFASGGQRFGASALESVLPINIQGWFPLRLTDLISLQSKGLSRVLTSTTVWKH